MNIHEYQAKILLKKFGLPILDGHVILNYDQIETVIKAFDVKSVVVKAQVHTSGRFYAGGVRFFDNKSDAISFAKKLYGSFIITDQTDTKGMCVNRIYVESHCHIFQEYYISFYVDRVIGQVVFMFCCYGGVNINKYNKDVLKVVIDPFIGFQDFHINRYFQKLNLSFYSFKKLLNIIKILYQVFLMTDSLQIEINPLVIDRYQKFYILDVKMSLDSTAFFRHKDFKSLYDSTQYNIYDVHAFYEDFNYVKMSGDIGCIVNGAGLAMFTLDMIVLYGGMPANFLDIGGSITQDRMISALKLVLLDDTVRAVIINIFGGIVRCDLVARALVSLSFMFDISSMLIVVRFFGNNASIAKNIILESKLNIRVVSSLLDAIILVL